MLRFRPAETGAFPMYGLPDGRRYILVAGAAAAIGIAAAGAVAGAGAANAAAGIAGIAATAAAAAIAALTADRTAAAGVTAGIRYEIREPDAVGTAGITGVAGHKEPSNKNIAEAIAPTTFYATAAVLFTSSSPWKRNLQS